MTEQEFERREAARRKKREKAYRRAGIRERRERWKFPGKVRVVDPVRGETVVPGQSPLAAILCAAEVWRCDWTELRGARVLAWESKKEPPPEVRTPEAAGNEADTASDNPPGG